MWVLGMGRGRDGRRDWEGTSNSMMGILGITKS